MEHDSPTLLFRLACQHLITELLSHRVGGRGVVAQLVDAGPTAHATMVGAKSLVDESHPTSWALLALLSGAPDPGGALHQV